MQNNPYTKESIERRLQRISGEVNTALGKKAVLASDSNGDNNNAEKPSKSGRELVVGSGGPRRIDCGLKSVDAALYRRDYYVNSNGKPQTSKVRSTETESSTRSDGSSSNVSDDGNYSCSGGSSSNEDRSSSYLSSPEISRGLAFSNKKIAEPIKHQMLKKV